MNTKTFQPQRLLHLPRHLIPCATLVLLSLCGVARAAVNAGTSVEAFTCQADMALHVKLTKVEITHEGPPSVTYYHCTGDIIETLHGKAPNKTVTFSVFGMRDQPQPPTADWLKSKDGLVVFLCVDRGQFDVRLTGKLTPITAYGPGVINLSDLHHVYDRNAHFITNPATIVPLVRAAAKALDAFQAANPKTPIVRDIDLESNSEIYNDLWDGSGIIFIVPNFPIPDAK